MAAITSMTAFARAQGSDSGPPSYAWTWEVRSVNAKGLDVRLRLPPGFEGMEFSVREAVTRAFTRGSVSLTLGVSRADDRSGVRLNEDLLNQLMEIVAHWRGGYPDLVAPPTLDGLLAIKGVLIPLEEGEAEDAVRGREARILKTLFEALDALARMRAEEGGRLLTVLSAHLDRIATLTRAAAATDAARPEAIRDRLRGLVAGLLDASPALPEERLTQEAALLAAKADVREELDRLASHVTAARHLLAAGTAVGRRLDFLCQEFNREANTLCAKSSSIELTRVGLDLKATIDQLREQVQNIE